MAKKKINIILIVVVIILWGAVGYKSIKNYFNDSQSNITESKYVKVKKILIERDTFDLKLIAYDPFLNKIKNPRDVNYKHNYQKKAPILQKTEKKIMQPNIYYYGYIKSEKSKEVAILKINNKIYRMHNGEKNEGVILKSVYKDSVLILFNKVKLKLKKIN